MSSNEIVISVSGGADAGKSTICFVLERALHDLGFRVHMDEALRAEVQRLAAGDGHLVLKKLPFTATIRLQEVPTRSSQPIDWYWNDAK